MASTSGRSFVCVDYPRRPSPRIMRLSKQRIVCRQDMHVTCSAAVATAAQPDKTEDYNRMMQQQMGWSDANPYEYHWDRGLYYHEVHPNLMCGTQPRNPEEVEMLFQKAGVKTILNVSAAPDGWNAFLHVLCLRFLAYYPEFSFLVLFRARCWGRKWGIGQCPCTGMQGSRQQLFSLLLQLIGDMFAY